MDTTALVGLGINLVYLLLLGVAGKYGYAQLQNYWVESKPNEWLIILRNGEMVKCAVGLNSWIFPGDQAITFPSQLNKLHFTAEQVSSEMQGVAVQGMLVWTVHREKDGPFRCYKAFGDDLKQKNPTEANAQLQNMAVSIIRDKIANLTINDILKNRQKLRNGVKDEMQKLLTGWGMWLETCEIQDVKIASKSLFTNLQTEFREKSRQEAEKISAETENQMRQEALIRNNEFQKIQTESQTKQSIFAAEQRLAVQRQEGELYEQRLVIENKRAEAENLKRIREEEMSLELDKKRLQFNGDNELYQIELAMKKEAENQKFNKIKFDTQQMNLDNELAKDQKKKKLEFDNMAQLLKIKDQGYTDNVLKAMILDTTKDIYKSLNIKELKVCNLGGGASGNQDTAGQLIAQVAASYKAISESM